MFFSFSLPPLPHWRDERECNDDEDHQFKVFFHEGNVPKEVTGKNKETDPDDPSDDVIRDEVRVLHAPDACNKRGERADDRDEAREDDRLPSMFFVESFRTQKVVTTKEAHILAENSRTEIGANGVVHGISDDRSCSKEKKKKIRIENTERRKGSSRKNEGIPGKEGCDHKPRFRENDEEEDDVGVGTKRFNHCRKMDIKVEEEIDDLLKELHWRYR